jgi:hypothetical protein
MFEKVTREKIRWDYRGVCSVEDLWDLGVEPLDSIFKELTVQARSYEGESLLSAGSSKEKELINLKIAVIRHIVSIKLTEAEVKQQAKEKATLKHRLLEIKASKQDEAFKSLPLDELDRVLASL